MQALEEGMTNLEGLCEKMQELGWVPPVPFYRVLVKIALARLQDQGKIAIGLEGDRSAHEWVFSKGEQVIWKLGGD